MIRTAVVAAIVLVPALALADDDEPAQPAPSARPAFAPQPPTAPSAYAPPPYAQPKATVPGSPAVAVPYAYVYPYAPYAPAQPVTKAPRPVPYEGGPIPEGTTLTRQYDKLLLGLGGGVLGGLWFLGTIDALMSCPPGKNADQCQSNTAWLYIPLAGPFLSAADKSATYGGRNLALVDGFLQLGAAATLIVGLATPKPVLEVKSSARASAAAPSFQLMPSAPGALAGFSFGARM